MSKKISRLPNQKTPPATTPQFDLLSQLLIVVIATTITTFPFIFDSFTVSKLFALSLGLTFITVQIYLNKSKGHLNRLPKALMFILGGFTISMILSWAVSGVPLLRGLFGQFGRGNGLFYYFFVILIFTFAVLTYKKNSEERVHQFITYLSWFMAVYASLQRMGIDIAELDTRGISPIVLTFGNSNFAGGMLSVLFAYHFTYVVIKKKLLKRQILLVIALAVSTTFPAAVQGYLIILFALAVGISFYVAREYQAPGIKPALLLGWIMAISMVVLGLFGKFLLAGVFARPSFQARIEYWTISLQVMRDNLLFGVGPDKLYDVTSLYMSPGSLQIITATRMDNAHNFYLNLGANYGLIALLFLLTLLIYIFHACLQNFKDLGAANAFGLATSVGFIAMFIDGLVSLEQPGIGIWLYLFAGLAVAASKISHGPENYSSGVVFQENSRNLSISKVFSSAMAIALLASFLTIGNRVVLDARLRSDIQAVLLNQGTKETLMRIESSAIRLASEPEYVVQALRPLAEIGDARKLDAISKASYKYYPLSIQASLIRADILRAFDREDESCLLRVELLSNSPWDFNQLQHFVTCEAQLVGSKESLQILAVAQQYLTRIDESAIPSDASEMITVVSRLNKVSVYARTYFIVGKIDYARTLQSYAMRLFERFDELLASGAPGPSLDEISLYKELLDF